MLCLRHRTWEQWGKLVSVRLISTNYAQLESEDFADGRGFTTLFSTSGTCTRGFKKDRIEPVTLRMRSSRMNTTVAQPGGLQSLPTAGSIQKKEGSKIKLLQGIQRYVQHRVYDSE